MTSECADPQCSRPANHEGLHTDGRDQWAQSPPLPDDMLPQPDIKRRKAGKVRVDLVPPGVMEAIATVMSDVLDLGLKGEDDWFVLLNDPPLDLERQMASAAVRHGLAVLAGEEYDPETGNPHVYHILTGASIWSALLYFREAVLRLASRQPSFKDLGDPVPSAKTHDPGPYSDMGPPKEPTWAESDLQSTGLKDESQSWLDTHDGQEATGAFFDAPTYSPYRKRSI